jgi:thioredoxin reductase
VVGSANGANGVIMQLAQPGRTITLVTSHEYVVPQPVDCLWKEQMQFVKDLENQGMVKFVENFRVKRIYSEGEIFILENEEGKKIESKKRPIICTGFLPNIEPIKELVGEYCEGHETFLALDEHHQSKEKPKLYVAGAISKSTSDEGFIAKFREFGKVIADNIDQQLHS